MRWRDVVVLRVGTGRAGKLYTLTASWTSTKAIKALQREGAAQVGPQKQQADIALQVRGTPELVEVQHLDIMQPKARLAAPPVKSTCNRSWLGPSMPGNGLRSGRLHGLEWPGGLRFQLVTQGKMTERGPEAQRCSSTELRGQLHGREISGNAAMTLTAPYRLLGTRCAELRPEHIAGAGGQGQEDRRHHHGQRGFVEGLECRTPAVS